MKKIKTKSDQNTSKTHQIAPFRDMQIPKSEKKNLGPPPLPNPGDAPVMSQFLLGSLKKINAFQMSLKVFDFA